MLKRCKDKIKKIKKTKESLKNNIILLAKIKY